MDSNALWLLQMMKKISVGINTKKKARQILRRFLEAVQISHANTGIGGRYQDEAKADEKKK
eukprot:8991851-Ditylum_brightwellii.AAC.1